MIQKLNGPRGSTAVAPYQPPSAGDNKDAQSWGSWRDGKHYRLEVIQQPIRARMCGFGDKDRRPLAPATVAKLVVHDEHDSPIDETEIDYSFFVVTADLWSGDGIAERNLVLHPTPSDRQNAANAHKRRRTGGPPSASADSSQTDRAVGRDNPPGRTKPPRRSEDHRASSFDPLTLSIPTLPTLPSLALSHPYEDSFPPLDSSPLSSASYVSAATAFSSAAWSAFNLPPPTPSLSDPLPAPLPHPPLERGERWPLSAVDDADAGPYRTWSTDPAYGPLGPLTPAPVSSRRPPSPSYSPKAPEPPLRSIELSEAPADAWPPQTTPASPPSPVDPSTPSGTHPPSDQSMYAPASIAQARGGARMKRPLPGHAYTRTLVGPLAANACKLFDQHRNPGVFFLFQDLSVRTEGNFRIRLRLMNIGAPPTTAEGLPAVLTGSAPVLAQTFTDAFDVYSAKRFPGVPGTSSFALPLPPEWRAPNPYSTAPYPFRSAPLTNERAVDTTALSIAFGNQGQKLPLRNRHGSRKDGRRRRGDGYDSDDDSD
ncbi:velvet factor-domain-containing protein [Vararia minispora EC-137]|uniref:Velvet factor-domain-containing protein n=1 Tax=Vararia minispora EC-137 TaxID=1314806 RepID=A0ACB8QM95_9AGAM|nr:velvet factor-domain-containing protein [Vararia minispora EC-137]